MTYTIARRSMRLLAAFALAAPLGATLLAQAPTQPAKNPLLKLVEPWPDAARMQQRKADAQKLRLFAAEDPLEITLTTDLKTVNKDRNPKSKKIYPAEVRIAGDDGTPKTIGAKLNARGHLRRMLRTCDHVPLRLTLAAEQTAGTVFAGQEAMKLVVQCRNNDSSGQHLLREYLAYRVMNVITPRSFRARLAKVTYRDLAGRPLGTRYGMLLEDSEDVAKRLEGRQIDMQRVPFADLHRETLDSMALFQYLLGNTDYSIYALHNVELVVTPDRTFYPVPYDFDVSGLVSPPYGIPDPRLPIKDVRERHYRGPCRTVVEFDAALAPFRAQKDRVLALPDTIADLDKGSREDTRKFLSSFYDGLKDQRGVKERLVDGCISAPSM